MNTASPVSSLRPSEIALASPRRVRWRHTEEREPDMKTSGWREMARGNGRLSESSRLLRQCKKQANAVKETARNGINFALSVLKRRMYS